MPCPHICESFGVTNSDLDKGPAGELPGGMTFTSWPQRKQLDLALYHFSQGGKRLRRRPSGVKVEGTSGMAGQHPSPFSAEGYGACRPAPVAVRTMREFSVA
eukprot:7700023-Prorocentrum_lima.AAC.1